MRTVDRTKYTGNYDRGNFYQGDTIPALSMRLEKDEICNEDGEFYIPECVIMTITCTDNVITYEGVIREDGFIIFDPITSEITAEISPGRCEYEIAFKLPSGVTRTYLKGSFKILRSNNPYKRLPQNEETE